MALITRLTRLMRADLHAVLDRLEEPDILLAQALREMEEAVAGDERSLRALVHEHRQVGTRRHAIVERLAQIRDELDTCLGADQDDLARALLRRRLEAERLDAVLARREQALDARIEQLTAELGARRERLEALRAEADLAADQGDPAQMDRPLDLQVAPSPVRDVDIEIALLAEKRRRAS
jgi:phage shock protein A